MRLLHLSLLFAVLSTANVAHAGDFDGAYVGFGFGTSAITDNQTNYSALTGGYASGEPNGWGATLADRGGLVSISGGYTWSMSGFLVGIDARIDRRKFDVVEFEALNGVADEDYTTSYRSDSSRQLSVRLGKMVHEDSMAYIKLGRAWSDYSRTYTHRTINIVEETVSGTDTGKVFGLGMEFNWAADWNVNVDVSRIVYDPSVATLTDVYAEDSVHDIRENIVTVMIVRRF